MVVAPLLLALVAPMIASFGSRGGRLGSTVSPPPLPSGRRRPPRVAAIVCVGSRSAGLGVVSQLVDHVDRVVVVHRRSEQSRRRLADLSGDPHVDLVPAWSGRCARSRAQITGLEHLRAHHAADAVLVVGGDVARAGAVVEALLDALPGPDVVVAEPDPAPARSSRRAGAWLGRVMGALVGWTKPDSERAAFLMSAEALSRVPLDRSRGRAQLRHPETMLSQGLAVATVRLPDSSDRAPA